MRKYTKEQRGNADKRLRELLKPGDTIHTVLRHVSQSGMYRAIDLYIIRDSEATWLSSYAAPFLEGFDEKREACRASGAGMDMGFHLVYNLSMYLFRDGFTCIGDDCPSNDHTNGVPRWPTHGPKQICDGCGTHKHRDGGYALNHRWL